MNGNDVHQPPNKKQRISPPPDYNKPEPPKQPSNPNHIPKRTMPKYTKAPTVLPSQRDRDRDRDRDKKNINTSNVHSHKPTAKELLARSEVKKFEQHGKVRILQKPNVMAPRHQHHNRSTNIRNSPITHNHSSHIPDRDHRDRDRERDRDRDRERDRDRDRDRIPPNQSTIHHHDPYYKHSVPTQPPPPTPPTPTPTHGTPYKVFPKRPQEIWNTRMVHAPETSSEGTDIGDLDFKVTFVWRAGCQLEWPFENISTHDMHGMHHRHKSSKPLEAINCSWKKDFSEIEKYMSEIKTGGKKQHLSHHWMLCEIHPYSTVDVQSYGDFCNFYKDLNKVSAAMCKSQKHQHLLFYLCPPDEQVLPEKYLDDIFECKIPKGLLWCLIFIKNLDDKNSKNGSASVSAISHQIETKGADPRIKDPRKRDRDRDKKKDEDKDKEREKKRKKEREKKRDKDKHKKHKEKERERDREREREREKEKKEKSVSLGVDDPSNLLGMLDGLGDQMKHEAGLDNNNQDMRPSNIGINDGKQEVDEDNDITMEHNHNNTYLTMSQEF